MERLYYYEEREEINGEREREEKRGKGRDRQFLIKGLLPQVTQDCIKLIMKTKEHTI